MNPRKELILTLAKLVGLLLAGMICFWLTGCGVTHRTVSKKDSTSVEKKNITQSAITATGFDSLHSVFTLSGTQYELKPGAIFTGSFADRERWLMNNSKTIIIYRDSGSSKENKRDTVYIANQSDHSTIKTEVKNKNVQKNSNTTLGANIPWYVWVILGIVILTLIYLQWKK